MIRVQHFMANGQGRDFVVGDLHGCRSMLDELLGRAAFDPTRDRLFAVGDLIDRGPDSMGVLALLAEPWFFSVIGNHEVVLLDDFGWDGQRSGQPRIEELRYSLLVANGGEWALDQVIHNLRVSEALETALAHVAALPQVIVVGEGADRFNVAHAELYAPEREAGVYTDAEIDAGFDMLDEEARDLAVDRIDSGRSLARRLQAESVQPVSQGLSPTYVGHSPAPEIRRGLSHVFVDTGAYLATSVSRRRAEGYGLTLVEPATGESWRTPEPGPIYDLRPSWGETRKARRAQEPPPAPMSNEEKQAIAQALGLDVTQVSWPDDPSDLLRRFGVPDPADD